jgi:hypothetical protein
LAWSRDVDANNEAAEGLQQGIDEQRDADLHMDRSGDEVIDKLRVSATEAAVVIVGVGDRVVAQWGGNSRWYSGSVLTVYGDASRVCKIQPDDGLSSANEAGWTDVPPWRVYKSNDDGATMKWCWRKKNPSDCPNEYGYVLAQSTHLQKPTPTSSPTESPTPQTCTFHGCVSTSVAKAQSSSAATYLGSGQWRNCNPSGSGTTCEGIVKDGKCEYVGSESCFCEAGDSRSQDANAKCNPSFGCRIAGIPKTLCGDTIFSGGYGVSASCP